MQTRSRVQKPESCAGERREKERERTTAGQCRGEIKIVDLHMKMSAVCLHLTHALYVSRRIRSVVTFAQLLTRVLHANEY